MGTKYVLRIIPFVLLLTIFVSCKSPISIKSTPTELIPKVSQQNPDIRGVINEIYISGGSVNGLFVKGKKYTDTTYDRAQVGVDEKTKIFKKQDDMYVIANVSDLKELQNIEVLFTGPILASDPIQAYALEIVIIKEE